MTGVSGQKGALLESPARRPDVPCVNRTCAFSYFAATLVGCLACHLYAYSADGTTDADHPTATFHTEVSEVQLTFSVTDQNHHEVATLNPSDFAVVDKEFIVRNFRSFSRTEYARLDVQVLVDTSGSVTSNTARYRQAIDEVVGLLSQTSGVPEESISVVSFHGLKPSVICSRDCRTAHGADVIPPSSSHELTPLYDSLAVAADSLSQNHEARTRRVIVLFSDGDDTISRTSAAEAIDALVAEDVHVYSINLVADAHSSGGDFLQEVADVTGGRSFRLSEGTAPVLDAVLADFHASYQVTYRLSDTSRGFHTTLIFPTRNLNLNFHCRRGYSYPADNR